MAFEGAIDESRLIGVFYSVFVAMMVGVAIASIALQTPEPPLPNSRAFGCYSTASGPPILLDPKGMTILQPRQIRIPFHLERHKDGIVLSADAPIAADEAGREYVYSIDRRGEGVFLDFFNTIDGRAYGVMDENRLRQFQISPATAPT